MAAPSSSDTSATFEDIDGDGVDDDCQEAALENTEAAAAAFEAADLNDDGAISVTEAAQSGWTGGTNCNHGGYVSQVAQADDDLRGAGDRRHGRHGRHRRDRRDRRDRRRSTVDEADCETDESTDEETEDAEAAEEEACEEVAAPSPRPRSTRRLPTATAPGSPGWPAPRPSAARTATTAVP